VLHRREARYPAIILAGLVSPTGGMDIYDVEYTLPRVLVVGYPSDGWKPTGGS
jgi:hypothetical protein